MLCCTLDRAMTEWLISRNLTENCIAPKIRKLEMKLLPPEDMKAYLDAANQRGLALMFYPEPVGCLRKGELAALRWDDLDIKTVSNRSGRYDAGFTLRTYTRGTRQKQDSAVERMGSFMAQIM